MNIKLPSCDSRTLGIYRFFYFGWLFLYFFFENPLVGQFPLFSAIHDPQGIFALFPDSLFDVNLARSIFAVFLLSLLMSCLGLFTRIALISALISGYWTIGHSMAAGVLSHQQTPHLLVMVIFAFGSVGVDFSLDKYLWGRADRSSMWEHKVSLVFLRSILVLVFFSAALMKLRNGAFVWWFTGANISDQLSRAHLWFFGFSWRENISKLNPYLALNPWLVRMGSVLIFILEAASPLMFVPRFRWPIIFSLAAFQIFAAMTLYVDFKSFIGLYLVWIPLEKLVKNELA